MCRTCCGISACHGCCGLYCKGCCFTDGWFRRAQEMGLSMDEGG